MLYKYGTYGEIVESVANSGASAETIPVYIGTAPVHLVKGWKEKGLVNRPVKVKSLTDAQDNFGYCSDWKNYTLCEAIAAHYDMGTSSIGPIYMINVLDPEVHKAELGHTEEITFTGGRALIAGTETIVDSIKIKRPLSDPASIGYYKAKADSNEALSSFGNKVTDCGEQTFYVFSTDGFDKAKDYLILVETNEKTYGVASPKSSHATKNKKLYFTLKSGKQTDYVDGKKAAEPDSKLDLASYTGPITMTLYECKYTDAEHYPTDLVEVMSTSFELTSGDYTQYYEEGPDYELAYNAARGGIVIQDLTGDMAKTVEATYELVDPSQVEVADVVGQETADGKLKGIASLKLLFMQEGVIPNLLAAPGWSDKHEVCAALAKACRKVNGHWDAMYVVDIPLEERGQKIDTIEKALTWKSAHKTLLRPDTKNSQPYNDERSKVCWPQSQDDKGRIFHLSTLCVAAMLKTDQDNGGYPFETCGNKSVPIIKQYFGEDTQNKGFDQRESDALCAKGITTVIPWAMSWQIWGDHTGAYDFDDTELNARCRFDVSMRMLMYITNSFQKEWALTIDQPLTRALIDTIVNREQEKLDQLVSLGALIGKPVISFSSEDNQPTDLMNGSFTWQIAVTPIPPLKSATVKVAYTDEGFLTYWGEE